MKVFFDTNVYVAEALLGEIAEQLVEVTIAASWRIYISEYVLDETYRVLVDDFGFSAKLAQLLRQRCVYRSQLVVEIPSRHRVASDAADTPILRAAVKAGVDYLVTNDKHLLEMDPYEGVRIVSMSQYWQLLRDAGLAV